MAREPKKPAQVVPLKARKCPICGKPAVRAHHPFCSGRCADVDLGRWLNADYRIPTDEAAGDPSDETAGDDGGSPGPGGGR